MATVAEVKKKAATKLGFSPNNALSGQMDVQMQDAYDETYEELNEINLVTWSQTGVVPDKVADYVADIMAWKRADVYATPEILQNVSIRYQIAEANIRRAIAPRYRSVNDNVDY